MKRSILTFIHLAFTFVCFAQSKLEFTPLFGQEKLVQGKNYYSSSLHDSIKIETLRFYISNIVLLKDNKPVRVCKGIYYLIDLENKLEVQLCNDSTLDFNSIRFDVGIDSATNVAGAMGGDLDPANGMYWTWQSGYINFKLEGKSKSCPARNNAFEFHIGGYASPWPALLTVMLPVHQRAAIKIKLDVEKIFQDIDLQKKNAIMSPGKDAVNFSMTLLRAFTI